jgi:tagatose 6-phosphate kinase
VISRGTAGALAVDETGAAWRVGPPPEHGDYPVGSGDASMAGFLAAVARGCTTAEAARHAVAAGTANALRPGQGAIDPGDVERIWPRVRVEPIPADGAARDDRDDRDDRNGRRRPIDRRTLGGASL